MDIRISQYILESGICLLVFYGLYYLLLRKETFFQLNRAYLLMAVLVSVLIPLFHLNWPEKTAPITSFQSEEGAVSRDLSAYVPEFVQEWHEGEEKFWEPIEYVQAAPFITLGQILWIIYSLGIVVMSFRFLQKFTHLHRLIRASEKSLKNGYTLVKSKNVQPASFMGYVFWNKEEEDNDMILAHELVHIRQGHSLDILLMECLLILFWFNPLMYWFRNSLKEIHEYIADEQVTRHNSSFDYACLLVQAHKNHYQAHLFNTFHSFIKKRLLMLQNRPSSNWRLMKYLITMPILCTLILLFTMDFSKELPSEIKQPFETAADLSKTLDEIVVVGYQNNANSQSFSEKKESTQFQIKWEDKICNCFPESEKTPNYLKCEGYSIIKSRLVSSKPFELLKNGKPVSIQNLWVRSNATIETEDGGIQTQELNQYEDARPFLKAIPIGYTARFNFDLEKEASFYFHVFVNDEKNSLNLTHQVKIGKEVINVDPMLSMATYSMDLDVYKKLMNRPIKLIMNDGTIKHPKRMDIVVDTRFKSTLRDVTEYRLKDFPAAKLLNEPSYNVELKYFFDEDETADLTIYIKLGGEMGWREGPENWSITWNNQPIKSRFLAVDREDLENYDQGKLIFKLNGKKLKVKSIGLISPDVINGPKENVSTRYFHIPGSKFDETIDLGVEHLLSSKGSLFVSEIEFTNGLIFNGLRIIRINDFDPAALYKEGAPISFRRDKREIYLYNPQYLDLNKLEELSMYSRSRPIFQINGDYYTGKDRSRIFDNLTISSEDQVTLYLPGSTLVKSKLITNSGHIDIQSKNFKGISREYKYRVIGQE